jgi:hypothetical protein
MNDTLKLLTSAQQKEWKMLRNKFELALKAAANGDRP